MSLVAKHGQRAAWLLCWVLLWCGWGGCQGSCAGTANPSESGQEQRSEMRSESIAPDASEPKPEPGPEPTPEPPDEAPPEPQPEPAPEGPTEPTATSRCTETATTLNCAHNTAVLLVGVLQTPRVVYWQTPLGTPPEDGWPVALMFQGSLFSSKLNWTGVKGAVFGSYYQTETLKNLLDAGYAVLTPVAKGAGTTFWDTNIPPYAGAWSLAPDHDFMKKIFEDLPQGVFGKVNPKKMYALGISSGGYMTSRMAVAYEGRFKALAIHSASYAHCAGAACWVPSLPENHPPTLFLHGLLDAVVPINTMYLYRDKLKDQKIPFDVEVNNLAAHEWISTAPQKILEWFQKHP